MSLSYVGAGAIVYATGSTIAPATSGVLAGDLMVMVTASKDDTASVTNPTGWTYMGAAVLPAANAPAATGVDAGPVRISFRYKVATANAEAGPTVSITSNVTWAQIITLRATSGAYDVAFSGGYDNAGGTAWSSALSPAISLAANDMLLMGIVLPTDTNPTWGTFGISGLAGATISAATLIATAATTLQRDLGGRTQYHTVTAGSATGSPTITSTLSGTTTNAYGALGTIRVREVVAPTAPTSAPTISQPVAEQILVTMPPTLEGGATHYNVYRDGVRLGVGTEWAAGQTLTDNSPSETSYQSYTVRGVNVAGESPDSPAAQAVANPAPITPTLTSDNAKNVVAFNAKNYDAQYKIFRGLSPTIQAPVFTDNFNRPNGALGADWTTTNSWSISSNAMVYNGGSTPGAARHVNDMASDDHYAEITLISGTDSNSFPGVVIAAPALGGALNTTGAYFYLESSPSGLYLKKKDSMSYGGSTLATSSIPTVAGDKLRLAKAGNLLIGYVNGIERLRATVADSLPGQRGVGVVHGGLVSNSFLLDNFNAGAVTDNAKTLIHTTSLLTAGSGTYTFEDTGLANGQSYEYQLSTVVLTPTVRESALSNSASSTPVRRITATNDGHIQPPSTLTSTTTYINVGAAGAGNAFRGYLYFPGLNIPRGETVQNTKIKIVTLSSASMVGNPAIYVRASAEDNPAVPTTYQQVADKIPTTAQVYQGLASSSYTYWIDITPVVQEIVNRPGWVSGNAILVLLDDATGATAQNQHSIYSVEDAATSDPTLEWDYAITVPVSSSDTLSASVSETIHTAGPVTKLRPDATVLNNGFTITGAATVHEAISDSNDSTHITGGGSNEVQVSLQSASSALSAGMVPVLHARVLDYDTSVNVSFQPSFWIGNATGAAQFSNVWSSGVGGTNQASNFRTGISEFVIPINSTFGIFNGTIDWTASSLELYFIEESSEPPKILDVWIDYPTAVVASTPVSASDSLSVSSTETSQITAVTLSASDTLRSSVAEVAALGTIAIVASDTLTSSATDTGTFATVGVTASDTITAMVTESSVSFVQNPGSDSLIAYLTEGSSIAISGTVVKSATDTATAAVTETSTIYVSIAGADALSASVTESISFATVAAAATDTLTGSLADSALITSTAFSASDALSAAVTESISFATVALSAPDTMSAAVTESITTNVTLTASDTLGASVSDISAFGTVVFSTTDSLGVSVTESSSFATVEVAASDDVNASVFETSVTSVENPGADTLIAILTESATVDVGGNVTVSATDDLTAASYESVALVVHTSTDDTLSAGVSESIDAFAVGLFSSDSLNVGLVGGGTPISDNFDRADATPISPSAEGWSWNSLFPTVTILSNLMNFLRNAGSNYVTTVAANVDLGSPDMYAQAVSSSSVVTTAYSGPGVRVNYSTRSGYFFRRLQTGATDIIRQVNGTVTVLFTGPTGITATQMLRIEAQGDTITAYVDGVQVGQVTDSTITSGNYAGIIGNPQNGDSRAKANNFSAGSLIASGEQTFIKATLEASDTLSASIVDSSAIMAARTTTDTLAVSLADGSAIAPIAISASDSLSASVVEVASVGSITLEHGDALPVSVEDASSLAIHYALSSVDSLNASLAFENVAFATIPIAASDALAASVIDAAVPNAQSPASDMLIINVSEQSGVEVSGIITLTASDTLQASTTETGTFGTISVSASDSLAANTTETTQFATVSVSDVDALAVSVTEASQFATTNVTAADTLIVNDTESVQFATVTVSSSDTLSASVAEGLAIFVNAPGTDSAIVVLSETSSIQVSGLIIKSSTETLVVGVNDASAFAPVLVSATENLSTSLTDSSSFSTVAVSDSDSIFVTLTEGVAFPPIPQVASDTLSVQFTDDSSTYTDFPGGDYLALGLSESSNIEISGDISVSANDSLAPAVTESYNFATVTISSTDALFPSLADVSSFDTQTISASDTLATAVTESTDFSTTSVSANETLNVSVSDGVISLVSLPGNDTLSVSLTETTEVFMLGEFYEYGYDNFILSVDDVSELTVYVDANDYLAAHSEETLTFSVTNVSASDTLNARVVEGASFGQNTVAASDSLSIGLTDAATLAPIAITATDNVTVELFDSGSLRDSAVGADYLAVQVSDQGQVEITGTVNKASAELITVQVTDNIDRTATGVVSGDTLSLSVTEQRQFETVQVSAADALVGRVTEAVAFTIIHYAQAQDDLWVVTADEIDFVGANQSSVDVLAASLIETATVVTNNARDIKPGDWIIRAEEVYFSGYQGMTRKRRRE